MKKHLLFIIALCISLSTIAAPWDIKSKPVKYSAWDMPLNTTRVVCDDNFLTDLQIDVGWYSGLRKIHFYVELAWSATVNHKTTVGVWGNWHDLGWAYKYWDVITYQGSLWANRYFNNITVTEEIWPGSYDISYDGDQ